MLFSMLRSLSLLFALLGHHHALCFLLSPLSAQRRARNRNDDEVKTLRMRMLAEYDDDVSTNRRRSLLTGFLGTVSTVTPLIVQAGIDPTALKNLPVEGDTAGTATRRLQIESALQKSAASDEVDKPWEDLPSGVSFRDYRQGRGEQGSFRSTPLK